MRHNAFNDQIRLSRRFAGRFITSVIALAVAMAAGCSSIDYQKLTTGEISGSLFVMWVGEGNSSGDGSFLFVPDPHDPLIFHRADQAAPGSTIKPGLVEQVRAIRELAKVHPARTIAERIGARNRKQVQRVIDGETYTRVI